MSIELTTYLTGRDVTPTEDALVYEFATSGDGILYGCDVSVAGDNTIFVASGHGIFRGRKFTVQEEVIPVALPTSGSKVMRLIIHMDLSNANKPIEFINQEVAIPLIQDEDINIINGVYELELATYILTSTSITDFRKTFTKLERGATTVTIDDVEGLRETAQLFKLTDDNGYSKKPGVSSWNDVTDPGNYYGEGMGGSLDPGVGRMHVTVSTPKKGSVMQFGVSATNSHCGVRTQDNGVWNDWAILNGVQAEVYDVALTKNLKVSKYATGYDNKIVVYDNVAHLKLRVDCSDTNRFTGEFSVPRSVRLKVRKDAVEYDKNSEIVMSGPSSRGATTTSSWGAGESKINPRQYGADVKTVGASGRLERSSNRFSITFSVDRNNKNLTDRIVYLSWYVGEVH